MDNFLLLPPKECEQSALSVDATTTASELLTSVHAVSAQCEMRSPFSLWLIIESRMHGPLFFLSRVTSLARRAIHDMRVRWMDARLFLSQRKNFYRGGGRRRRRRWRNSQSEPLDRRHKHLLQTDSKASDAFHPKISTQN
jgi:hypothetical protein